MTRHPATSRLLLAALAMSLAGAAQAALEPIQLAPESFNEDVVVEKTAAPVLQIVTTASMDAGADNTGATWMEAGFDPDNPGNGLPAPGTILTAVSNANYSFQMPPSYTAPNGMLIDTLVTNGTFTLTTPATYTLLSFLTSGGVGGDVVGVRVHHLDGSTETGSFGSPDWFYGTSNVAFIANERVGSTVDFTFADVNSDNPRLYFRDMPLTNTTSAVSSIDLYYLSGQSASHSEIVAVSGAPAQGGPVSPIAVTGYTYDFVVEASAARPGRLVSTNLVAGTNTWATSQSMADTANSSWTFYEQGYNFNNPDGNGVPPDSAATNTGLPSAGSSVTNAAGDHIFNLPTDYAANNACYLSAVVTEHSVTFASPTDASMLSFLCTAGGGPARLGVVIHHQDGSTQTNSIVVADWSDTAANNVFGANGTVDVGSGEFSGMTLNPDGNRLPLLHNTDVLVANTNSPITGIDFTHDGTGGQVAIFAVSGTSEPAAPVLVTNPQSLKAYEGDSVQLTAIAVANIPYGYQWQKFSGGVFVDLSDSGTISGTTTTNLSITPVSADDETEYRCVVSDSVGSATSAAASLTVLSALKDVTSPVDFLTVYQPNGGSSPAEESPPNAIDDSTTKYLNFGDGVTPMSVPVGFIVAPSKGRTIVSAMRLYTANDAPERDPANVILEGSNDGGQNYSLIYSNSVTLPDGRNDEGLPLDPLNQNMFQVRFDNTNSFTSYRWYTTQVKGISSIMQIGEVELLGEADTANPAPFFSLHPASRVVYDQSGATFNVFAGGTPSPGLYWQRSTNGIFMDLDDSSNISGSHNNSLNINPVSFADAGDYLCIATNTSGSVTSLVAHLTVVSTNVDVTQPGDPIMSYGDASDGYWENDDPANAIDDFNITVYQNGGSGLNAKAGFGPWEGPAGVIVTPSVGRTIVTGVRLYTAEDLPVRDPTDYVLEGSNDGGTNYELISSGPLSLPDERADTAQAFDPTVQPMQEVLFANNTAYTSYRLTFDHLKDANPPAGDIVCLQLGEIELLGVVAGPAQPSLSITPDGSGGFTVESVPSGLNVYSATNLSAEINWTFEGITPLSVSPNPSEPEKFFQVRP